MKGIAIAAALAMAVVATGCARFQFYTKADLKGDETGLKLYPAKPYVLVAHQADESKAADISVVYLPDLANPYYATPQSGWGSSNLTMTITNGVLTQFGQQVDNGGAANLTSLGSLVTAVAGARKAVPTVNANETLLEFSLYEVVMDNGRTTLRKVAVDGAPAAPPAPNR